MQEDSSRRDDRAQPRVSTRFQPWEHAQQHRTALKGRQVWNCQKPDMIPIEAAPDENLFLRTSQGASPGGEPFPGLKPG